MLGRIEPPGVLAEAEEGDDVLRQAFLGFRREVSAEKRFVAVVVSQLRDLPEAWNAKMEEYLGLTVPDDARGVLQDTHWSGGMIGYFPTYLLGTVMSVQIWQKAAEDLPELEDAVGRGEFAPLRDWLGEHVHRLGRKFSPQETLRRATGSEIDAKPYLAYLESKYRAGVAA